MLTSLEALDGARVLDLFAGTGALGIEALSRGAAEVTFVEASDAAVESVRANLVSTGLSSRGTVVRADVIRWLQTAAPADLAFVDPPYSFPDWQLVLGRLAAGVAVLESDRELDVGHRWDVLKSKRYGGTVVTLVRPRRDADGDADADAKDRRQRT